MLTDPCGSSFSPPSVTSGSWFPAQPTWPPYNEADKDHHHPTLGISLTVIQAAHLQVLATTMLSKMLKLMGIVTTAVQHFLLISYLRVLVVVMMHSGDTMWVIWVLVWVMEARLDITNRI